MKLILADDHTLFRNGLALLLKAYSADCEIWEGDDLDSALAEAQAHPDADVALLDLNMPGMEGVRGIRRFVDLYPGLPLIILTGAEELQQIQEVLAAGASGFIPKSSTSAVMLSAIQLVLSGGTYVPPQALSKAPATAHTRVSSNVREHAQTRLTERQMQALRESGYPILHKPVQANQLRTLLAAQLRAARPGNSANELAGPGRDLTSRSSS